MYYWSIIIRRQLAAYIRCRPIVRYVPSIVSQEALWLFNNHHIEILSPITLQVRNIVCHSKKRHFTPLIFTCEEASLITIGIESTPESDKPDIIKLVSVIGGEYVNILCGNHLATMEIQMINF